ncbi:MAG: PolyA polymerase [candidate division WS6 bacterium GW2011_GWB1_33_6]|uniref:PolyA polymerase n=1 Tax=candidate division WS6 bacterium GW2011_GWB1_33_6 TaxID=1619088 RepID=A0A0G0ATL8_9BACT|nr:MAG: PolyA polymerase [candidate division WS6 bacterium GW2011_GWB1_33_6]
MKVRFKIPSYVQKVASILAKEDYDVYLVGGAIRDIVMGRTPHDFDLATSALPDEMLEIFPRSVATGVKFGTVLALVPDIEGENREVEVTTFRSESDYVDGRWPSKVEFVNDIFKDLGRRDFTINAMALNLSDSDLNGEDVEREWEIFDPFNGVADINSKVIRAVGTPIERFKEDGLRAFKACRLASQLDFEIEEETLKAIKESIPVAKQVSMERIRDEFMKLLLKSPKPSKGIELMRETGLLNIFLPELLEGYGVEQKLYHSDDVYWHSLKTCDFAEDSVKLAALLHDIAKPRTDMGNGHFYGHDVVAVQMVDGIMRRLKFSKSETDRVKTLVRNHMFYYPHAQKEESKEEKVVFTKWSDSAVRRFIRRVGEENIEDLFKLRIADATSNPNSAFKPDEITELQKHISKVRQEDMAIKIEDMEINGEDLKALGVEPGRKMGEILNRLLDIVIEDPLMNTKEKLLEEARRML